jgi:hypothetical protein
MSRLLIRLGFVGYVLTLAVFALGRFSPAVHSVLRAVGLRSAVGILGYLFAGLVVSYVILWQTSKDLRRGTARLPETQPSMQQDLTALEPSPPASVEMAMEDSERR